MRLTTVQLATIKATVHAILPDAAIKLFGSRIDDTQKGGDIDLYIMSELPIDRPAWAKAQIEARLMKDLNGRKVDILLDAPNLIHGTIHERAQSEGVPLN